MCDIHIHVIRMDQTRVDKEIFERNPERRRKEK
jgi:hypothetical protein